MCIRDRVHPGHVLLDDRAFVQVRRHVVGSGTDQFHTPVMGLVIRLGTFEEMCIRDSGSKLIRKGEEMGRFLLGSTVVMLFPKSPLQFNPAWQPGGAIRLGEAMAGPPREV